MNTVVAIEKALQTLPVEDARKVAGWLQAYLDEIWDNQVEGDIAAGRLDKLWDKAKTDIAAGRVKPLDEIINDQSFPGGFLEGLRRLGRVPARSFTNRRD